MTNVENSKLHNRIARLIPAVVMTLAVIAGICMSARAQDDPPGRIARLNYSSGSVVFQPMGADENDWVPAVPDRPLITGDRLWVSDNGPEDGASRWLDRNTPEPQHRNLIRQSR